MSGLVFYEKPGCVGNAQQKALLRSQGIEMEVRDLLSEPWSRESLRPFFGEQDIPDWFNSSAPKVKSGEVAIHDCSEEEALTMMLAEPLLIRRPLMAVGEIRQAGFEAGPVISALGVRLPGEDLQTCPMSDDQPQCDAPA
jgi:nitrogenase-associated protein